MRRVLEIPGRVEELETVRRELSEFVAAAGIEAGVGEEMFLAAEEVLVNTISYGYQGAAADRRLEIEMEREAGVLRLRFRDDARAFDPLREPEPDLDRPIEERPVGGLGIHLVRSLADRVSYVREPGRNVLTIEKDVGGAEDPEGEAMTLKIDTETRGTLRRIHLTGRLDTTTAPQLEKALGFATQPDVRALAFDLGGLEYISSAGIRTLFRAEKTMKEREGAVAVVNLQPPVQKVFDIVKAMPADAIFATWEELDAYLDRIQRKVSEGED